MAPVIRKSLEEFVFVLLENSEIRIRTCEAISNSFTSSDSEAEIEAPFMGFRSVLEISVVL